MKISCFPTSMCTTRPCSLRKSRPMTLGIETMRILALPFFALLSRGFFPEMMFGVSKFSEFPSESRMKMQEFDMTNASVVPPQPEIGADDRGSALMSSPSLLRSSSPTIVLAEPVSSRKSTGPDIPASGKAMIAGKMKAPLSSALLATFAENLRIGPPRPSQQPDDGLFRHVLNGHDRDVRNPLLSKEPENTI